MVGRSSWIVAVLWVFAATPAFAQDLTKPTPKLWNKRGVYFFEGSELCPLAGLSARPDYASNRVVLDDAHSVVTWIPHARRIVFTNTRSYEDETQIGGVLLLGTGTTESGKDVPIGVHLYLYKDGDDFEATVHAHVTVREGVTQADFLPLQVVVDNGSTREVVLTKTIGLRAVRSPFSKSTLAQVIGLKGIDNLEGKRLQLGKKGARLADGAVELGHGFISTRILRAQMISVDGSKKLPAGAALAKIFEQGGYELRLTALSSLLPQEKFARDLFLLGLDEVPILQEAKREGLQDGETLIFSFKGGKGTIRIGEKTAAVPNASEKVRRYLEFDFLGTIMTHQMQQRLIEKPKQTKGSAASTKSK